MPKRIRPCQNGQTKRQRHAQKANAERIGITANLAANTALPQPPSTSHIVPKNSAVNFFANMITSIFTIFVKIDVVNFAVLYSNYLAILLTGQFV